MKTYFYLFTFPEMQFRNSVNCTISVNFKLFKVQKLLYFVKKKISHKLYILIS